MNSHTVRCALAALLIAGMGCGATSPEKCGDRIAYSHSCGANTDCGEYFCYESNGQSCLDGACAKMCTKHCQSAYDCPSENSGMVLESECKGGICVATKCEIK